MNWDALSAVAQLIATVGLFVSVAYAGIQLRHSTRLARITAEGAAAAAFRDVILPIAMDAELARIWQAGLASPDALSVDDRVRFYYLSFQALKGAEAVHSSFQDGVMDQDTWTGWNNVFERHLTTPGLRRYWKDRSEMFAPSFQKYVRALPEERVGTTVANLTELEA